MKHYSIRSATPDDAESAAQLIFLSATLLFRYLFYHDIEKCQQLLAKLFAKENNAFTYQNAMLLETNQNMVAGLIYCVDSETQADNEVGTRMHLMQHFGIGGALLRLPRFLKFASFSGQVESNEYFINHIAVHQDHRRQGLAHKMLQWAEDEAKQRGHTQLGLYVDCDNEPAQKVYQTFGFVHKQRIPVVVKVKNQTMRGQDHMLKSLA